MTETHFGHAHTEPGCGHAHMRGSQGMSVHAAFLCSCCFWRILVVVFNFVLGKAEKGNESRTVKNHTSANVLFTWSRQSVTTTPAWRNSSTHRVSQERPAPSLHVWVAGSRPGVRAFTVLCVVVPLVPEKQLRVANCGDTLGSFGFTSRREKVSDVLSRSLVICIRCFFCSVSARFPCICTSGFRTVSRVLPPSFDSSHIFFPCRLLSPIGLLLVRRCRALSCVLLTSHSSSNTSTLGIRRVHVRTLLLLLLVWQKWSDPAFFSTSKNTRNNAIIVNTMTQSSMSSETCLHLPWTRGQMLRENHHQRSLGQEKEGVEDSGVF